MRQRVPTTPPPMLGSLFTLALLLAAEASPQDAGPPLRLTWDAAPGCPDITSERASIERRVGELGPTDTVEPVQAEGTLTREPSGDYRLRLKTRVGAVEGEREIVGRDCRELADAAALVLALLFHPEATSAPKTAPAPVPNTPAPSPPASSPPRHPFDYGVGLAAVLAKDAVPTTGQGLGLRAFHRRGPFSAELAVTGFLPAETRAPVLPDATASFLRFESALHLCAGTSADARLGVAGCVGGAFVRMRGESTGVSKAGAATAYWPEAILTGAAQVALTAATRLRLALGVHGLGTRPDFAILGLGHVYRPASAHFRGALGFDVLF